jgi:SAM-dependent methyltransferase
MLKPSRLPLVVPIVVRERLTRGGRVRVPEPMVMADLQEVAEYDQAGATVQLPLHHCNAMALGSLLPPDGLVVDLGCGSGRQLLRLALGRPDARLIGLDLSTPMLETGRRLALEHGIADRVELRTGDIASLGLDLAQKASLISCCLALHHLSTEELAVRCLEAIRQARERTGCGVYIFDLVRLRHPRSWPAMLSLAAIPGEAFLRDAIASERAAFTFTELTGLLQRTGLADLQHACVGPLGEYQLHWVPGQRPGAPSRWQTVPLPREAHLLTWIARRSFPRALMRRP